MYYFLDAVESAGILEFSEPEYTYERRMIGAPATEEYIVKVIGEGKGKIDFLPYSTRTVELDDWLYDPISLKFNSQWSDLKNVE